MDLLQSVGAVRDEENGEARGNEEHPPGDAFMALTARPAASRGDHGSGHGEEHRHERQEAIRF